MSLDFKVSSGCFGDFIIVKRDTPNVRAAMLSSGARRVEREHYVAYLWGFPDSQTLLSGIGVVGGRLVIGPTPLDTFPDEILGQCVMLDLGTRARVRPDVFGMHPVFVGGELVTNRLHLAALVVGRLDTAAHTAVLLCDSAFSRQLNTLETPVSGVRVLRADEEVEVESRVSVRRWPSDFSPLDVEEYRSLIRRGAEDVRTNVAAALDSGRHITSAVTGGRDSRVVFAALVSLGRVAEVGCVTAPGGRDIEIGSGLVRRFGGAYRTTPFTVWDEATFETRVDRQRSWQLGTSFFTLAAQYAPLLGMHEPATLHLDGGCGEVYRDFYHHEFPPRFMSERGTKQRIREMLDGYALPLFDGPHIVDEAFQQIVSGVEGLPGTTISQKLDAHYLNFRNRFHFMSAMVGRPTHLLNLHPMMSTHLLRAARGLPAAVRSSGRVLFDVTRELCEELAYLPYDTQGPDFSAIPYHTPSRFDREPLTLEPAPELVDMAAKATRYVGRPPSEPRDLPAFFSKMARSHLESLRGTPFAPLVTRGRFEHIDFLERKRPVKLSFHYVKLQSMLDCASLMRA